MGVGYAASALHVIQYLDTGHVGTDGSPPPSWLAALPGVRWGGTAKYYSVPARDIIAWRRRIAAKYRSQLGERLTWNENGKWELSADVAVDADTVLRYAAARVDETGPQGLRALVDAPRPAMTEITRALQAVERRGFTSRFPQLLLVSRYWLPLRRNMIIEEPDWKGTTHRFGSSYHFASELNEIRSLIRNADPRAVDWTPDNETTDIPLWAAWQASETIERVTRAAVSRHLPLWSTS